MAGVSAYLVPLHDITVSPVFADLFLAHFTHIPSCFLHLIQTLTIACEEPTKHESLLKILQRSNEKPIILKCKIFF